MRFRIDNEQERVGEDNHHSFFLSVLLFIYIYVSVPIGKVMMKVLEPIMNKNELVKIMLTVFKHNEAATDFFKVRFTEIPVVDVYHVTIVAIGHGLLKKFWPLVIGCVLRTEGS